jgi:uncharacterized protein (DUF305 family)
MRTTRTARRRAVLATGAALTALLAACGGGGATDSAPNAAPGSAPPASSSAATAEHNDADIRFAQMMIPHHRQAVAMAEVAADRADSQPVTDLADQIRAAQEPEIATLTGFLQAWGAEVPADGGMGGMDHSGMAPGGMTGMTTPEQMDQLEVASGTVFDAMFLQMMIAHHEGAITDAQAELAEGSNPQAKDLAQKIVDDQRAEIAQMQQLLQAS